MMTRLLFALILISAAATLPVAAQAPSPRTSLIQADQAASQAVFHGGIVAGLGAVLDDSVILLYAGAPPVSGKERVTRLLNAQSTLKDLRLQWFPIIVAVSQDGLFGVTSGASAIGTRQGTDSALQFGHYITVWRRAGGRPWRIIAMVQNGVNDPDSMVIPDAIRTAPGAVAISEAGKPFAQADIDFARLAADSGAPIAFGAWAAPDVTTPPGTGIMAVGPAQIRARNGGRRSGQPAVGVAPSLGRGSRQRRSRRHHRTLPHRPTRPGFHRQVLDDLAPPAGWIDSLYSGFGEREAKRKVVESK